ncbi:MAG: DUF4258 domain-containing protein [Candidatus Nanohaloarchaea archaeon]
MERIKYTHHAEKRLKERFISKQDVENGIINRKWQDAFADRKKVVQPINGKDIEVVFKHEDNKVVVITVYWR